MKIMISGSSGLIGSALGRSLRADGHDVAALPRTYDKPIDFSGVDAVVHLAGENIASGRWSPARKQRIEESRVRGTRRLAEQLRDSGAAPSVFICASAIGYYGERGDEAVDENSPPGSGFLPDVCVQWEAAAAPAAESGIRTVHLRTGIVLSREGGALKKMLPPFTMGAGGIIGSGRQYMSWISLEDEVRAIRFLMKDDRLCGAVNLTAPQPVTNREFTKALGRALHRPTLLPLPAFAVKALFGEMGEALLLGSTRALPKRLAAAGYSFHHARLSTALEALLR